MTFEFDAISGLAQCPGCGASLRSVEDELICTNPEHRLEFSIKDGIPLLLAEEARELSVEDWNSRISTHTDSQDEAADDDRRSH